MLHHPTLDKLNQLKFTGMSSALSEQQSQKNIEQLSFEERLGLLVDREITERDSRRLHTRLRQAKLRHSACMEDIDYRHPRGLDKSMMLTLADGHRILCTLRCEAHTFALLFIAIGDHSLGKRPHSKSYSG